MRTPHRHNAYDTADKPDEVAGRVRPHVGETHAEFGCGLQEETMISRVSMHRNKRQYRF
jgi:hypothetical protein